MSLKELDLNRSYASDREDIVGEFYNPVLSQAKRYDRISAYFSSGSFVLAASGLTRFIRNDGKMRLIFDTLTSQEDKDMLEQGVQDQIKSDLNNITSDVVENHVALLAWLIEKNRLEIKIAKAKRTYHPKFGIFYDNKGNKISFSGSNNETFSGWKGNIERFKVFCGWIPGQKEFLQDDEDDFREYWENKRSNVDVHSLEDALKKKILSYSPETREELQDVIDAVENLNNANSEKDELTPRDYQSDAIESWKKNDYRGIWKMATGTGKTLTAIWGMEQLIEEKAADEGMCTVIVAHTKPILHQWKEDLEKRGHEVITTQDYKWSEKLSNEVNNVELGSRDNFILLTTYHMYNSDDFKAKINGSFSKFLIADEVHHSGSTEFRKGLSSIYDYKLGLSATPERYMDDEGTELIIDYFEGIVKRYGLEKAINAGHLSPYQYHVRFVELTEEELKKYKKHTKDIAVLLNKDNLDEDEAKALEKATQNRAKLAKMAEKKPESLDNVIDDGVDVRKSIIFCEETKQVNTIKPVLDNHNIIYSEFNGDHELKERNMRARNLKKGKIDTLLAMKVLDEGFDLPEANKAFLIASSGNPAQYVQRRGRVLRVAEEDENPMAHIYDFLVIPGATEEDYEPADFEKNVVRRELNRFEKFAKLAENYDEELHSFFESLNKIYDLGK